MKNIETKLGTDVSCFEPNLKKKIVKNLRIKKTLKKETNDLTQYMTAILQNLENLLKINIEMREELENVKADLSREKEKTSSIHQELTELRKRKNLEFFVRCYFGIPFSRPISNISEVIKAMFDEIKENFRLNEKKVYADKSSLDIKNYFAIVFDKGDISALSSLKKCDLKKKVEECKEYYLSNLGYTREIVDKVITTFMKTGFFSQNKFTGDFYSNFDKSKKLFSKYSNILHEKKITPMKELFPDPNQIEVSMLPFKILTNFYQENEKDFVFLMEENNYTVDDEMNDKRNMNAYESIEGVRIQLEEFTPNTKKNKY